MRRTRPRCALLCTWLRVALARAHSHVDGINFGDLLKNSPIRQIKIPAKVSSYLVCMYPIAHLLFILYLPKPFPTYHCSFIRAHMHAIRYPRMFYCVSLSPCCCSSQERAYRGAETGDPWGIRPLWCWWVRNDWRKRAQGTLWTELLQQILAIHS